MSYEQSGVNNNKDDDDITTPKIHRNNNDNTNAIQKSIIRNRSITKSTKIQNMSNIIEDMDEPINILVEIIGAYNVTVNGKEADDFPVLSSPDGGNGGNTNDINPYCKVNYDGREIHKTKTIEHTSNPIWTIETGSLFLVQTTTKELMTPPPSHPKPLHGYGHGQHGQQHGQHGQQHGQQHGSLVFHILSRQKDIIGINNKTYLGRVCFDHPSDLLPYCTEERLEFDLKGCSKKGSGALSLRFRIATNDDVQFVQTWNRLRSNAAGAAEKKSLNASLRGGLGAKERKIVPLQTDREEFGVAASDMFNVISTPFVRRTYTPRNGQKRFLTKPHPDPDRPRETLYLTNAQIRKETFRPSHSFIEAGSGTLGKVFLEILSCHDLPNMDAGGALGNLTDAFVCAVYEDAVVQSPVINDELSPYWLPWTERAFAFRTMHPASNLYLGVFDYDLGPLGHEPIGRIAVNLSNLRKDTVYTLKYDLYPSSDITDRIPNGSITIRLRMEIDDEKKYLIEGLKPRPQMYVNVKKDKSFHVIRYTCYGEHHKEEFIWKVFRSYINEIFEYKRNVTYAIGDALRSLLFWRGQVKLFGILLPLHSLAAFVVGIHVVETPHLILPCFFFSIAWFMLACMTSRQNHPSPWYRCKSFWNYLDVLRYGESKSEVRIDREEGWEEQVAYDTAVKERLEKDLYEAEKKAELQVHINEIGDDKIATAVATGGALNLELLARLGRYQGYLKIVCNFFRKIKIIVTWEESMISFWITAIFSCLGILCLILPWARILQFLFRAIIWTFLGPWMKLVDIFLTSKQQNQKQTSLNKMVTAFRKQSKIARLRGEEAAKLRAMKIALFGNFITEVPRFNLARYFDFPLKDSFAFDVHQDSTIPWTEEVKDGGLIAGQQLHGVMVPRPEGEAERNRRMALREWERLVALYKKMNGCECEEEEEEVKKKPNRVKQLLGDLFKIYKTVSSESANDEDDDDEEEDDDDGYDDTRDDEEEEDELGFEVVSSNRQLVSYIDQEQRLAFKLSSPDSSAEMESEPLVPMHIFLSQKSMEFMVPAKKNQSKINRTNGKSNGGSSSSSMIPPNNRNAVSPNSISVVNHDDCPERDDNDNKLKEVIWEEGIEVIDYDNSSTTATANNNKSIQEEEEEEDDENEEDVKERDNQSITSSQHSTLSCRDELSVLYRSSDYVSVAFYHRHR